MKAKHNVLLVIFWAGIVSLFFTGCKKDVAVCLDENAFCSYVNSEHFDSTRTVMNDFLKTINKNKNSDEKLEALNAWLACKSCVSKAEIFCNSCIKTNPPQSELRVHFLANGKDIELTLDVLMDEPLRFVRYHE